MNPQRILSKREHIALQLLRDGLSTKEIAREQFCAPETAKKRLSNIYFKMGVSNAKQAITAGFRQGILTGLVFYLFILPDIAPMQAITAAFRQGILTGFAFYIIILTSIAPIQARTHTRQPTRIQTSVRGRKEYHA